MCVCWHANVSFEDAVFLLLVGSNDDGDDGACCCLDKVVLYLKFRGLEIFSLIIIDDP